MAIHSVSDTLYWLFDEWSATGAKYVGQRDTESVWNSFSGSGIGHINIGTLFQMAKEVGWTPRYRPQEHVEFQPMQKQSAQEEPASPHHVTLEERARDLLIRAQHIHGLDIMDEASNQNLCQILWEAENIDVARRTLIHDEIRSRLGWTKNQLSQQLQHVRRQMVVNNPEYVIPDNLREVLSEYVYVKEINQFFRPAIKQFLSPDSFRSSYCHTVDMDESVTQIILQKNMIIKVDRVDYCPGQNKFFEENGVKFVNLWNGVINRGIQGDPTPWLTHFDVLGWSGAEKKHILQWMAFTLLHPGVKINHILLLGGPEGNGKDFLLHPLKAALGENTQEIEGDALLREHQDHLLGVKYLHVNETEHGNHTEADKVVRRLKPLGACPPYYLNINPKGVKSFKVRNVVNVSMTTNERVPLKLNKGARRFYPLWSDVSIRGPDGNITEEWARYWAWYWPWMRAHWPECVYYLMNKVDLSDFDPGQAPPVTAFLREIQEASSDPLADLIADKIQEGEGLWGMDILTSYDIHDAIIMGGDMLLSRYGLRRRPSVKVITQTLNREGFAIKLEKSIKDESKFRGWLFRNHERYTEMSGRGIRGLYEEEREECLKIVFSPTE
jgi:hypothetical protein